MKAVAFGLLALLSMASHSYASDYIVAVRDFRMGVRCDPPGPPGSIVANCYTSSARVFDLVRKTAYDCSYIFRLPTSSFDTARCVAASCSGCDKLPPAGSNAAMGFLATVPSSGMDTTFWTAGPNRKVVACVVAAGNYCAEINIP
jgi:hypothetical protein